MIHVLPVLALSAMMIDSCAQSCNPSSLCQSQRNHIIPAAVQIPIIFHNLLVDLPCCRGADLGIPYHDFNNLCFRSASVGDNLMPGLFPICLLCGAQIFIYY